VNKTKHLHIRIDQDLKTAADARAKAQGVTLSQAVRNLLEMWIAEQIYRRGSDKGREKST